MERIRGNSLTDRLMRDAAQPYRSTARAGSYLLSGDRQPRRRRLPATLGIIATETTMPADGSRDEVEATVADYLAMLAPELAVSSRLGASLYRKVLRKLKNSRNPEGADVQR